MKTSKTSKMSTETATAAKPKVKGPKVAKAKGRKFNGNWDDIPSSRMLLALVIRAWEAGETNVTLPTTREGAIAALGYVKAAA
jgi:hypothetical protein